MKKIWKILVVILILFIVILMGRKIYYTNVGIAPEDLYLRSENSQEEFKASKGSYKWDDKGMQVIADSISPLEMDFSKSIEVKQNGKIYLNDCEWTSVSAVVILQQERKEVARIAMEANLEENYIVAPSIALGEYVIQINLKSDKGDVWYASKINIVE